MGRVQSSKNLNLAKFNKKSTKNFIIPTIKNDGYRWDLPIVWSVLSRLKHSSKYLNLDKMYVMFNIVEDEY